MAPFSVLTSNDFSKFLESIKSSWTSDDYSKIFDTREGRCATLRTEAKIPRIMRTSAGRCGKCAAESIRYVCQWHLSGRGVPSAEDIHYDSDQDKAEEDPDYSYVKDTKSTIREKLMRNSTMTLKRKNANVTLQPLTSDEKIWLEAHRVSNSACSSGVVGNSSASQINVSQNSASQAINNASAAGNEQASNIARANSVAQADSLAQADTVAQASNKALASNVTQASNVAPASNIAQASSVARANSVAQVSQDTAQKYNAASDSDVARRKKSSKNMSGLSQSSVASG